MKDFRSYRIAGKVFGIRSCEEYFTEYCKGYECDDAPEILIDICDEDIDREITMYSSIIPTRVQASLTVIYRRIAESIIDYGGFFMHSAVIEYGGRAIAFLAPSGTGKSTHIKLWRKILGNRIDIVNGDKPLIVPDGQGGFLACGTPWAGKEGWQRNVMVPLAAVCCLTRSEVPFAEKVSSGEFLRTLMAATVIPKDPEKLGALLDTFDKLLSAVPTYKIGCNLDESSAVVSFETITGEKYIRSE